MKNADKSVQLVSNDVSATCGILSQLKELLQPTTDAYGKERHLFKEDGLKTLKTTVEQCSAVFTELKNELANASKQIAGKRPLGKAIELSSSEKAKWPFRQPRIVT